MTPTTFYLPRLEGYPEHQHLARAAAAVEEHFGEAVWSLVDKALDEDDADIHDAALAVIDSVPGHVWQTTGVEQFGDHAERWMPPLPKRGT